MAELAAISNTCLLWRNEPGIQNAHIEGDEELSWRREAWGHVLTYLSTGCGVQLGRGLALAESRLEKGCRVRREAAHGQSRSSGILRRIEFGRLSNLTKECVQRRTALCKHGNNCRELY